MYETVKLNPISLLDDSNLDSDLKTLLVGGEPSGLELSKNHTKINTSIEFDQVIGNIKSTGGLYINDGQKLVFNNNTNLDFAGSTYIVSEVDAAGTYNTMKFFVNDVEMLRITQGALVDETLIAYDSHLLLTKGNKLIFDSDDNQDYIAVDASNDDMEFYVENTKVFELQGDGDILLKNDYNIDATTDNALDFQDSGTSVFKIETASVSLPATNKINLDGSGGHTYLQESSDDKLDMYVGGDLALSLYEAVSYINILSGWKLMFDGGTHTYIQESSADVLDIYVGNDNMLKLSEKGDDGNEIAFGACAGFTQLEPTYDATDTIVDFRFSNKQFVTFGSGNITNLQIRFPLVSGNFVLLVKQDGTGSRTITNYKAMEFDESAADGAAAVKFAGGSNPTLTTDANHVDILSFYWDADNEIAYGVATLDFQF